MNQIQLSINELFSLLYKTTEGDLNWKVQIKEAFNFFELNLLLSVKEILYQIRYNGFGKLMIYYLSEIAANL